MPYEGEKASKLGHLTLLDSKWVHDLVTGFERAPTEAGDPAKTPWTPFDPTKAAPLPRVWAVDGSFVPVASSDTPPREVAFVKTALVLLDREQMADIDPHFPPPARPARRDGLQRAVPRDGVPAPARADGSGGQLHRRPPHHQ